MGGQEASAQQGYKLFEKTSNIAVSETNKKPTTNKTPHTPVFLSDSQASK